MRLVEKYEIPAPVERVSPAFDDVLALAPHVPGAVVTSGADGGPYAGELGIAFGPRVITLKGTFTYSFDAQSGTGRLEGSGTDRRGNSRATGYAVFSLTPVQCSVSQAGAEAAATQVSVEVDLDLTGPLSSIAETGAPHVARAIFAQFSDSLATELRRVPMGESSPPGPGLAEPVARNEPAVTAPSAPVNGFRLAFTSLGHAAASFGKRLWQAMWSLRRSAK
jgi:carbon-monoxide dehydrogenase small subunit